MKNVNALLEKAEKLVWAEIEKKVTKILLSERNAARGFICCMGGYFWIDSNGDAIDDRAWMNPVFNIFDKYDDAFKLTGIGWRWDLVNGKVVKTTDW